MVENNNKDIEDAMNHTISSIDGGEESGLSASDFFDPNNQVNFLGLQGSIAGIDAVSCEITFEVYHKGDRLSSCVITTPTPLSFFNDETGEMNKTVMGYSPLFVSEDGCKGIEKTADMIKTIKEMGSDVDIKATITSVESGEVYATKDLNASEFAQAARAAEGTTKTLDIAKNLAKTLLLLGGAYVVLSSNAFGLVDLSATTDLWTQTVGNAASYATSTMNSYASMSGAGPLADGALDTVSSFLSLVQKTPSHLLGFLAGSSFLKKTVDIITNVYKTRSDIDNIEEKFKKELTNNTVSNADNTESGVKNISKDVFDDIYVTHKKNDIDMIEPSASLSI